MPPRMRALSACWSSWSIMSPRGKSPGSISPLAAMPVDSIPGDKAGWQRSQALLLHHLAAIDLDQVHAGHVLPALLACRPLLDEGDVAVDTLHLDVPQRLGDGLGFGLARRLGGLDDDVDAVPTAETLGQTADVVLLLVPQGHELSGDVGVLHRLGEPRREEHQMVRAVGGLARLGDQL